MRRTVLTVSIALVLTAIMLGQNAKPDPKPPTAPERKQEQKSQARSALMSWISKYCALALDPSLLSKYLAVRSLPTQLSGTRLTVADLNTQYDKTLVECGACWSPAVTGPNQIAYVGPDGIWVTALETAKARLAIPAEDIAMIVGRAMSSQDRLLVLLRTPSDTHCYYKFGFADFSSSRVEPVKEGPASCLSEADADSVMLRPDSIRNGKALFTSAATGDARSIMQQDILATADSDPKAKPALPWVDQRDDGVDRFDPIWIDSNRVLYVEK
jgi:hypothetical protein